MDLQLNNKVALVTGSYRGTGLIIAQALAAEGARVLVHGLTDGQAARAIEELASDDRNKNILDHFTPVTGDIVTEAGTEQLVSHCRQASGQTIDVLINNYGTADPGSWLNTTTDDWLLSYQKNVLSAQRLVQALLPAMVQVGWGRIINLGTVGSTRPNANSPQYYSAKGALATMTISLAKEVAGTGVRVNLISPGMILTPEVKAMYMKRAQKKGWGDTWPEVEAHVAKDIPIRRIVTREEVANLVTFVASPMTDGLHGQNIRIDGGALDILS